jgi:hypothetical protein
MNCELMLTYDTPAYMLNVYKSQLSRQTGSRNLTGQKTLPTKWGTYMKLVTKYQISTIKICWEKCDKKKWAYMFNVYKNQQSRQTGSRNLTGPKTPPTIWHTYMKLVTKYQISVIDSCWEKCDKKYLGRTDRQTEVKQYTLSGERGYNNRMLYRDLTRARFELTTSVVIGTDCNYHTSTTMTAPTNIL